MQYLLKDKSYLSNFIYFGKTNQYLNLILTFIINVQKQRNQKMKKFLALKNRIVQSKQQPQVEINRNFSSINSSAYKIKDKSHLQRYKTESYDDGVFEDNDYSDDCNKKLFLSDSQSCSPSQVIYFDMMTFRQEFNSDQNASFNRTAKMGKDWSSKTRGCKKSGTEEAETETKSKTKNKVKPTSKSQDQVRFSLSENIHGQKGSKINSNVNAYSCTNRHRQKCVKEDQKRIVEMLLANLSPLEQNKKLNQKIIQIKKLLMEVAEDQVGISTPNEGYSPKKVNCFNQHSEQHQYVTERIVKTDQRTNYGQLQNKKIQFENQANNQDMKQVSQGQLQIRYRRIPNTTCTLKNISRQSLNSSLSIHQNRKDCDTYTSQMLKQYKPESQSFHQTSESYYQRLRENMSKRGSDGSQSQDSCKWYSSEQEQEKSFETQEDINFTSHKNSCEEPSFEFASLDKNCGYFDSHLGVISEREQQQQEQASQVSKSNRDASQVMQYYLNSYNRNANLTDKDDFEDSIQFRKIHYILQGTTKKTSSQRNSNLANITNEQLTNKSQVIDGMLKKNLFLNATATPEQDLSQKMKTKKTAIENDSRTSINSKKIGKKQNSFKSQSQNEGQLKKKVLNDAIDLLNKKYKKKIDFRAV